ncbi:glycosyltransferase (plasmid) [Cetobacterium somerae]|uniref:glycosyltransferase n=1 Tax=Cetobacterium somerae TaxID=188913 RepID=UPI002E7B963B|nr:glycosyltransferase [Cetobacterium somerae]WVJ02314.1 glycosyltransferase [Cetobacterium somerae]
MSKKLAIVNHNLGSGGAEKLIYDIALELKERNLNFSIILLTSVNDIYGKKLQMEGIDVIYLSNKWDIYSPKNIFRLRSILENYDVVHTHIYAAQLWTAFASLFLDKTKKYITTEHNTHNRRREKILFKFLDRWMYSKYTIVVSITENVQNELQKWIKLKLDFRIIKNGINLEKYVNAVPKNRDELNLKITDKLICQVARFNEVKTHETMIQALRLLPEDYKVLFLGEGNTEEKIRKLVKDWNLLNRVKFLGYQSNVPEIVKMCDLSVLTSRYEGLPISAIEAMCLNPFVGSNVPGIKELVENVGELFDYKNYDELSKKIKYIIENKDKYLDIKEKCRKRAFEFNIKNTVSEYIEVYGVKDGV